MRYSVTAILATFVAIQTAAASTRYGHNHFHTRQKSWSSTKEAGAVKRDLITPTDLNTLNNLPCIEGINANTNTAPAWIGFDGPYTNTYTNSAGADLILVIWGPDGSWVNKVQPLITLSLASNAAVTISFEDDLSGAWSAIYADTQGVDGQISNTWGEFTFAPAGVVDVSRMRNMSGHEMTIVGPMCTATMESCVFECISGHSCMANYTLQNCANGSQEGAQYGLFDGNPSGGCGWQNMASAALRTQFF